MSGLEKKPSFDEVLEGNALAGERLVLLVTLWNRWVREQADPSCSYPEGRLSGLFPERVDLARGALDFAELLGAVVFGERVRLPRGTALDRFVSATFPENIHGWLWEFIAREFPS